MEQLHNLTQFACNILKEMLQIESYSFNEGKRADFLCNILSGAFKEYKGVVIERIENNILLYNKDTFSTDKKTLMLNSHIDTVTPASTYTFNPHSPFEKDGAIYGLGSNDDGGSVVSQIAAFMHLCNSNLNVNLVLLLSAEEERSGANGIALALNKMEIKPDFAIIGEPTGMKAAIAERGLLVIDGTATGVSGHAAREEGVNALYIALDDINTLRNFNFDKVSPVMGKVKLSVTQLNCGTVHNVVPDKATFVVDIRPTEQYTNPEIMELLQKEVKSELKARNLNNKSSATQKGSILYNATLELGIEHFVSPTTSDWMKIEIPAIKIGPGESSRSHKADEFIKISEIESAIAGYINIIKHL